MTQFTRRNAWDANNGGQFTNIDGSYTDLYWYAKGVAVMKSKPISDPTSWWFYAAIHGQYLINNDGSGDAPTGYPNWTDIKSIPATADLSDPPAEKLTTVFWDQCQHGTWFFPPWHRGYLVALENILRDIIVNQFSGPSDWALPYWNYLNQSTQYEEYTIPPAFTAASLPDGTPNSLFVPERYGPKGDGNVYLVVGPGTDPDNPEINDEGQWDTKYSESSPGSSNNLNGYFYGGQETGFSHSNGGFGDLESNPHNFVHVMVGGFNGDSWTDPNASASEEGLMADPGVAALDPIFYLHHANIDRMWSAWNVTGNNTNPSAPNWLTGPSALGNSMFAMPLNSNGKPWYYTPSDVESTLNLKYIGSIYSYTYDDLSLTSYDTTPPASLNEKLNQRLLKLGVAGIENNIKMSTTKKTELVGASANALTLNAKETGAIVTLDTRAWNSVSESLLKASSTKLPDEVYLQLENVKGTNNANFISLFVNDTFVKSVALFGIRMASMKNSPHGGSGLTFKFNITAIIDDLHLDSNFSADALNVQIKTKSPLPEGNQITIDRISVYRVSQ